MQFPTGEVRIAHPHMLAYIGNLPELALVSLTKCNHACPICMVQLEDFAKRLHEPEFRTAASPIALLHEIANTTAATQAGFIALEQDTGFHLHWVCHHGVTYGIGLIIASPMTS